MEEAFLQKNLDLDLYQIVDMLSEAIELSENGVGRHGKRVACIAKNIYEKVFEEPVPCDLVVAAVLHDIGAQNFKLKLDLARLYPEEDNLEKHSADGEALLAGVDLFRGISSLVRNHHKAYKTVKAGLKDREALCSNIINLADRIDIAVDKSANILSQAEEVVNKIQGFPEGFFSQEALKALKSLSSNLSFWLDINNERRMDRILKESIARKISLSYQGLWQIADLCAKMIDRKSPYTAVHSSSVSQVSSRLSRLFGFDGEQCFFISVAGKFHDLGKLCIPESILEKPGELDYNERCIIKQHAYYSYHILDRVAEFQGIKKWAAYHHENLDGTGYPFSLKEDQIPMESRIVAVADKLVALTEDRPYRRKMQKSEVIKWLKQAADMNWIDGAVLNKTVQHYDYVLYGL
ncbi:MAG: HD domain-containing protein [Clostridiales bacterium]|jgi:HD-GYP domain-containing protein (c-di-GMP phosphodiesterase class II)|nr:HD domain-containing protein [Eubacteriales bacterium]MDH7566256.1 HD domain-containing protein [Clostridiales bacterium]